MDRWKQTGCLYLWRYAGARRDYEGWHLTADTDACRSTMALLDVMIGSANPSHKEIRLARASEKVTRVVDYNAPVCAAAALTLACSKNGCREDWSIKAEAGRIELIAGADKLRALRAGLEAISKGEGDYSIGEPPLWFWWHLGTV